MRYDLVFDCKLREPHTFTGGISAIGGKYLPELSITWNYGAFFRDYLGKKGIRSLYGKTASEVIDILDHVIPIMGGDADGDYWAYIEGNTKQALINLRDLAKLCPPDAELSGD